MEYFDWLADEPGAEQAVGSLLGLGEDNGLARTAIDEKHIAKRSHHIAVRAMNRNVLNILLCLVFDVLGEVDQFPVFLQVISRHALDPVRNCRRE